jgi:Na+-driven multidrug efflux pump
MTEGPLFGRMMLYTIPIIITGVLQLLFNAADLVIVGQFGSSKSDAVAAVGCTASITALFTSFFIGCSAGGGVAVAHSIGANNKSETHKSVHTIIPFSVICGSVISVIGVFFAEPLLKLMDTPENILGLSTVYMQIIFAGMNLFLVLEKKNKLTNQYIIVIVVGAFEMSKSIIFPVFMGKTAPFCVFKT